LYYQKKAISTPLFIVSRLFTAILLKSYSISADPVFPFLSFGKIRTQTEENISSFSTHPAFPELQGLMKMSLSE